MGPMRSIKWLSVGLSIATAAVAGIATVRGPGLIYPGQARVLAAVTRFPNRAGEIEIVFAAGPINTKGHPFFEPLGTNGRACVTCHQPKDGMSVSVESIRQRWGESLGKDPIFAAADGSNCPTLPQAIANSHSLLLNRGLFRIALPWPRTVGPDGKPVHPDFDIEVISDPTGCNTDPEYGLHSKNPTISVYRRPRPVANLKYATLDAGGETYLNVGGFNQKRLGMVDDKDPVTGKFSTMNFMADARYTSLQMQSANANDVHLQSQKLLTSDQVRQLIAFESQVFSAMGSGKLAGDFSTPGTPPALGARAIATARTGRYGDILGDASVFGTFESWRASVNESKNLRDDTPAGFRASVARGYDVFLRRPFWISEAGHLNSAGLGSPIKRTCSTCHQVTMVGMDIMAGWIDIGTNNLPWAQRPLTSPTASEGGDPELPLFKITCHQDARPHPYLGRVIYTQDPGRALISGKCVDVGSIVMAQLRGLSARAPYFANGSAENLRSVVDFYDRRFNIGYSEREKVDLTNFMSIL